MISGQPATFETRADCQIFEDFALKGYIGNKIAVGKGCIYPPEVPTLAKQLKDAGKTWRAYMEDMGNNPRRESATCGHPAIGSQDNTQKAVIGDQYATRHNPFMYFHAIIDDQKDCDANVVNLDRLPQDLKAEAATSNYNFITPNLCNDGHDDICVDGAPGGLPAADVFLKKWVPIITQSPAYQHDGLLIVTFDESDASRVVTNALGGKSYVYDGLSCCSEEPGPNLDLSTFPQRDSSGTYVDNSFGGDRMGTVLLSPFLTEGTRSEVPFNHYSLLKTIEDIFGLVHLGYAAQPGLIGFFGCAASDVAVKDDPEPHQCKAK